MKGRRDRAVRILLLGEIRCGFFLRNDDSIIRIDRRRANVVRMSMAVNDMSDWLIRHAGNCSKNLLPRGWRRINSDHTFTGDRKHHLMGAIVNHVSAAAQTPDGLADVGINRRACRCRRNSCKPVGEIPIGASDTCPSGQGKGNQ
ncbi:hypothetical protein PhaeoP23_02334 [Phaeobacter piscinae]|uniref:Transposase n=3 Tax=Phaeobacter piscinae TaxID=1580596 RepID=A0ABM7D8R9_9RHOB|nr:hypothetical protein PhaeoP36_02334 [Phaeobacter piscinae]AUQ86980.1 hypothetical protein PhaeoP42_02335 [Phaeobacter piscinae]AUR24863.1 hypothetical protein PhaeoP23_02334 [Phaeobacter piscinae]